MIFCVRDLRIRFHLYTVPYAPIILQTQKRQIPSTQNADYSVCVCGGSMSIMIAKMFQVDISCEKTGYANNLLTERNSHPKGIIN